MGGPCSLILWITLFGAFWIAHDDDGVGFVSLVLSFVLGVTMPITLQRPIRIMPRQGLQQDAQIAIHRRPGYLLILITPSFIH